MSNETDPFGECGCGKGVRYDTASGWSCNKHFRCMTYEQQRERIKDLTKQLSDLHKLLQDIVNETAHLNAYPPSIETRILVALPSQEVAEQ